MTAVTQADTRAWTSPSFRRLWAGSSASTLGSEIGELALPLLALLTLSATAGELSIMRAAQFLPFLLATLPIGLLVDQQRQKRLHLMIGSDLGRFALVATIPLAVWMGLASMELLWVVVFAVGVLTVLYQMADFALLPSLVGPEQLVDANGKLQATASASEIGGRGVAGLLVQAVSAPVTVGLNAVGYLLSALSLSRIQPPLAGKGVAPETVGSGSGRKEIWAGLRLAATHRYVGPLLREATTFNFFNEIFVLGLMIWAVRDLELSPGVLGLVFTAGGLGSFVGAWFGSRATGRFGYGRVLLVTLVLGNGAPLALLLPAHGDLAVVALLCAVFVTMGVGIGIANVHGITLRQGAVPAHLYGRINAAYRLVSWGAIPLGAGAGGLLASAVGGHAAVLVGASGISTATIWVAISAVPPLRSLDEAVVADL